LVAHDIKNHPVVAHAELPIPVERLAKALAILIWGLGQTLLDGREDAVPDVRGKSNEVLREIMVKQDLVGRAVRHPLSPSLPRLEALPEISKGESLLGIEGLSACLTEEIESAILAERDGLPDEVRRRLGE
jgi:hypothetical protein